MPIKIPTGLPAYSVLEQENIFVMPEDIAFHQDIRPLKIAILNLMPTKTITETQLLRLIGNTPLQIEVTLLHTASYISKNTSSQHLNDFYRQFFDVKNMQYDGCIITGAPVENMDFNEVKYWEEICSIMEWTKTNVQSTFYICWGAQAGLYYHYDIPKYPTDEKIFGSYKHKLLKNDSPLLRGFDDIFFAPHSRHTEVRAEDIEKVEELEILSASDEAGVYIVANKNGRQFFVTGHSEYDRETLSLEYFRDVEKGLDIKIPVNYFPENDASKIPSVSWRSHAHLLFSNWLNYYVYQKTPFNINEIK